MTEKNKRPIDPAALEEAAGALWGSGAEQLISGEQLSEAAGLLFGPASAETLPAPAPREDPDDWARVMFG